MTILELVINNQREIKLQTQKKGNISIEQEQ